MAEEFELDLPAGRVHAPALRLRSAPLVLAVHGLSANMHAFELGADHFPVMTHTETAIALDALIDGAA